MPGLNETQSHGNETQTQGQGLPSPPGEAEGGPEHRPPSIPRPCNTQSTRHAGKEGEREGRREQGREGRREEEEGGRREEEDGGRRGKEGGGLNEPEEEKDRCCFRGGRGALVLLLRSLSLALYSASVPGQGARRGGVTGDRHSPPQGEERADRTNVTRYKRETERKRKQEKISWAPEDEPGVAQGPRELRPHLDVLSHHPECRAIASPRPQLRLNPQGEETVAPSHTWPCATPPVPCHRPPGHGTGQGPPIIRRRDGCLAEGDGDIGMTGPGLLSPLGTEGMQDAPPGCAGSCRQFIAAGNANKPGRAPLPSAVPSSSALPWGHLVPARGQAGHPPCPRWHRRTGSNGDSWTRAGAVPTHRSCPGHPAAAGWDRAQDPSLAPAPGAGFSADTKQPFPTHSKASFEGSPFFHPTFFPPRSHSMGLGACGIFSAQTHSAVWASRYPWVWWLPWLPEHLCGPEPPKQGSDGCKPPPTPPAPPILPRGAAPLLGRR